RSKKESRVFRIDRIIHLKLLTQKRSQPVPTDVAAIRNQSSNQVLIRFKIDRSVFAALQREFKFQIESETEDFVIGTLFTSSLDFFRWHLKSYAPFIEVLEPEELKYWIINQANDFPIPDLLI
ncbi:MAG: WYL domain-containing protein, partial [Leptonema sp. (in: Bacteria)]|nr:WYL domain-containing protein [Leptonema sp. (in: bacteria)]